MSKRLYFLLLSVSLLCSGGLFLWASSEHAKMLSARKDAAPCSPAIDTLAPARDTLLLSADSMEGCQSAALTA
ncbi:MAG TPA: hypothetical protein VHS96_11510 [Bacteroidia bacterium]|nr:hypothetical protein [Bacteroidia bacterium]